MADNFLADFDPFAKLDRKKIKTKKGEPKTLSKIIFKSVKELSPTFSFKYLSLEKTGFCFNNPEIVLDDFITLFETKKELSKKTYKEIAPDERYHFHDVKLNGKRLKPLQTWMKNLMKKENNDSELDLPEIFQIAVYTTQEKAPRMYGFFGKHGVFYVVWLDLEHIVYSTKKIVIPK